MDKKRSKPHLLVCDYIDDKTEVVSTTIHVVSDGAEGGCMGCDHVGYDDALGGLYCGYAGCGRLIGLGALAPDWCPLRDGGLSDG